MIVHDSVTKPIIMMFIALVSLLFFHNVQGQCDLPSPEFLLQKTGFYLANHVVQSMTTDIETVCRIKCYLGDKCMSYNYHTTTGACDINDSDEFQHPADLVPRDGYIYVGTQNDCLNNTCPDNTVCSAHVREPASQCKPCRCNKATCAGSYFVKCQRNYDKVGAFKEEINDRALTKFVLTYRHCPSRNNGRHLINWKAYEETIHSLACECASLVKKKGWKIFGLHNQGECWSGPGAETSYSKHGQIEHPTKSKAVQLSSYVKCNLSLPQECIGIDNVNYIYRLKDEGNFNLQLRCDEEQNVGIQDEKLPDNYFQASSILRPIKEGSWSAETDGGQQWLMVNLGKITKIVAIATKGVSDIDLDEFEWVESYFLSSSQHGDTFDKYENDRIFTGNTDNDTFVTNYIEPAIDQVRYIKVHPKTWHVNISMRIELYECRNAIQHCSYTLGMTSMAIKDDQIKASSSLPGYPPSSGRLHNGSDGWTPDTTDVNPWFQVFFVEVRNISGIATQGRYYDTYNSYLGPFSLNYSNDSTQFLPFSNGIALTGNSDLKTIKYNDIDPHITAKYVRIIPKRRLYDIALRVEFYGCDPA